MCMVRCVFGSERPTSNCRRTRLLCGSSVVVVHIGVHFSIHYREPQVNCRWWMFPRLPLVTHNSSDPRLLLLLPGFLPLLFFFLRCYLHNQSYIVDFSKKNPFLSLYPRISFVCVCALLEKLTLPSVYIEREREVSIL